MKKPEDKNKDLLWLPLLQSKITCPVFQRYLVPRSRLKRWSKSFERARVVVVHAPAGFGKTTLLVQWHNKLLQKNDKAAWLTLDEGDNDPGRFLSYLINAIEKGLGSDRDEPKRQLLLNSPGMLSGMMHGLFAHLESNLLPLSIFLDDFGSITNPEVVEIVQDLVQKAPDNVRFFLAQRALSDNNFESICGVDNFFEIDMEGLRFNQKETELFVCKTQNLSINGEDLVSLHRFTEGWVAGLQLTTLSQNWREFPDDHVSPFASAFSKISDFLAEDVLTSQTEEVQSFLLQTSILRRLSTPLCNALTGRNDSEAMLDLLEKSNLFLTPLNQERVWYRYHSLFSRFLLNRLERGRRDQLERLHITAAQWHAEHGDILEAVRHALAVYDHERAASYLETAAFKLIHAGQLKTVAEWGERLPLLILDNHPDLLLAYGYSLLLLQQYEKVTEVLERLDQLQGIDQDQRLELQNNINSFKALLSISQDKVDECEDSISSFQKSQELRPDTSLVLSNISSSLFLSRNRFHEAENSITEGLVLADSLRDSVGRAYNRAMAALLSLCQGRLREARGCLQKVHEETCSSPSRYTDGGVTVAVILAEILYEMNFLEEAESLLKPYLPLLPIWTPPDITIICLRTMARIRLACGDKKGARESLSQLKRLSAGGGIDRGVASAHLEEIRIALHDGDTEKAIKLSRKQNYNHVWRRFKGWQLPANDPETSEVSSLRLMMAEGRHVEALVELKVALKKAQANRRLRQVLLLRILMASALALLGSHEESVRSLQKALVMAQDEGFVRIFVDHGPPLPQLLQSLRQCRISDPQGETSAVSLEFVDQVLAAMGNPEVVEEFGDEEVAPTLLEPLTDAEFKILKMLDNGFSNDDLAEELSVSVNTIRYHLRNINTKLGSSNRNLALAFARRLGMLR